MQTNVLVLAQEAVQTKDSMPLSLADNVGEIVVQDSIPDKVTLDVIVEDEEGSKTSTSDITIHG